MSTMLSPRRLTVRLALALVAFTLLSGARLHPARPVPAPPRIAPVDRHSYANAREVVVRHVALDLTVDFDRKQLHGSATLEIENRTGARELVLDTRGLAIERVTLDGGSIAAFSLGANDDVLGRALVVPIARGTREVRVEYTTSPLADGLHWMTPAQAGQATPYLYSQNEPIDARSWIPVPDSPQLRMTWSATIRVPPQFMAVMSAAGNPREKRSDGVYSFDMPLPVPAYLIGLAVADLEFRAIDARSGVYAAPAVIDAAARELAVVPAMMTAAERIAGPYRWERYDIAIMPPSYHLGGMEHPRLNFINPSFISGDGSLVSLIAHELGHSWSGDLVTNANWNDPWINEGLTVWLERRIMEELYGRDFEEMLAWNGAASLRGYLDSVGPTHADTRLHLDFTGRDPNYVFTSIAYEKGGSFTRTIEEVVGREAIDQFMRLYFSRYAFQWMDDAGFLALVRTELVRGSSATENLLQLDAWVYGPGLPSNAPVVTSTRFAAVDREVARFRSGVAPSNLVTSGWSALEFVYFLRAVDGATMAGRMGALDAAFGFSSTRNLSLLLRWSFWVATLRYSPSWSAMERYLMSSGGYGGLATVYGALLNSGERARALEIYGRARPRYHPFVQAGLDQLLLGPGRVAKPARSVPETKR
jgi:aminopeptidase N